ncbi:ABC transporter ATP-binding protein [Paraburkholderia sp. LEh10]|uniref:ABC transporter ATP-binding protein n=1 Tax=Paraburkholderia sp. LEh10 TaxID=2821353 RepID=UPI001AE5137F|nr:ABC transporter ATP-binding protein [Paraburkholderia sp. LEh10]MBP0595557.1 ABC transporter ATP-binding protein [Paraburkholderia sp. LEh10]
MDELSVDNLFLNFGSNPILNGVSFDMRAGEVVCLLGASGSGKTTLLRAIAGLEQPLSGCIRLDDQVFFDSRSAVDLPVEQRSLGLVFQSYALWPHRTVADNVAYGLKLRRVNAAEQKKRVQYALGQLGIGHLAARYPYQLSGGQQQRVAIARALVYNPPVILLDEPLSNLDAKLREEARAWLRELIVSLGLSALCVTHDQTEAMAMSDRILLLRNGRIEQEGTPAELYGAPCSLYAAEFMGSNNRIDARVMTLAGNRVTLAGDGWHLQALARDPLLPGQHAQAVIRVERLHVADGPGANCLRAQLVASTYLGDRWEYLFDCGDLRLRAVGRVPRTTGEHWIELPVHDCWAFARAD